MNVASLELCKELYELSGWGQDSYWWHTEFFNDSSPKHQHDVRLYELLDAQELADYEGRTYLKELVATPAYDLGYLLRKLERAGKHISVDYRSKDQPLAMDLPEWVGMYTASTGDMSQKDYPYSTEPEAAVCRLAIELFKQGVLTPLCIKPNGGEI